MEPNTNPLGNPGPASGMPSGFPPSSNPPQGTSAPAGAVPAASTSVSQSQIPDAAPMPDAGNASNVSMGAGDPLGATTFSGADGVLTGGNNAFSAPEPVSASIAQAGMPDTAVSVAPSIDSTNATPVNPVPGTLHDDATTPLSSPSDAGAAPVAPIGRPTNIDGINQVRVPDVPGGQIASSQSNPFAGANDHQTPNVSFNDPAVEPRAPLGTPIVAQGSQPQKKKSNKTVLIILSVVAFIVAVGLAVVLVMEVTGTGLFAANSSGDDNKEKIEPQSGNGGSDIANPGTGGTVGTNGIGGDGNGTGSNSGTGNGGGSGGTSNGQTSDTIISCDTTTMSEYDGSTVETNVIFNIVDNKINDITMSATMTDAEGHEQSQTQTYTFEEMLSVGTFDEQNGLVAADGTLLVSPQEVADYMQSNVADGESTIICTVR